MCSFFSYKLGLLLIWSFPLCSFHSTSLTIPTILEQVMVFSHLCGCNQSFFLPAPCYFYKSATLSSPLCYPLVSVFLWAFHILRPESYSVPFTQKDLCQAPYTSWYQSHPLVFFQPVSLSSVLLTILFANFYNSVSNFETT